jgi:hypothetical protein
VGGCAETARWCKVSHDGTDGWAYGDYLSTPINEAPAPLYENRVEANVTRIEVQDTRAASATGGGTMGALVGGVLGGPVGLIAGAAIGAGAGAATDPGPQVVSYVSENPVETVYVQGEVVTGAQIPDTVTLYPVPESELRYVYLNNVPVVVDADRRVITIVR